MNNFLASIWAKLKILFDRYPIIITGVVIYLYYLATSLDFFKHSAEKHSFFDYIFQFDSLFFLWLAALAYVQLRKARTSLTDERRREHEIERILIEQHISQQLIDDLTKLLQDNVNNPLAVISLTSQELRRKFERDEDMVRWLDRIDGSLARISNTIRDVQAYESRKLLELTAQALAKNEKQQSSQ